MEEAIAGWKDKLERAHRRIADLFARSEVRERSLCYLEGLLSVCERKNSWQVAEWAGEASPYAPLRVGPELFDGPWEWASQRIRFVLSRAREGTKKVDNGAVRMADQSGFQP